MLTVLKYGFELRDLKAEEALDQARLKVETAALACAHMFLIKRLPYDVVDNMGLAMMQRPPGSGV